MADEDMIQNENSNEDWTPWAEWWGKLIGGCLFLGLGIWLYHALGKLEQGGKSFRINWFMALAYKFGGRWGAIGLCTFFGVLFLVWGIKQFRTGKE